MLDISVKEVNKQIDEFTERKQKPESLQIGYKTYAKLMREDKFQDKLKSDSDNLLVKYYREIKIKIVTEKHYFEVK